MGARPPPGRKQGGLARKFLRSGGAFDRGSEAGRGGDAGTGRRQPQPHSPATSGKSQETCSASPNETSTT